ncbi:MAG: glycerophosphodiester phosphodiesterase family protein [Verrucomicrobiota bacterium]
MDAEKTELIIRGWKQDVRVVWDALAQRHVLARLVAVRIMYGMLAGLVLGPLAAGAIQWLTKSGGGEVISNFDLSAFFLSFQGMAFLVLTVTFALTVFFFEQSGMIIISRASLVGGRLPRLMEVLWIEKNQFPRLLRLGLLYFLAALLVALPLLIVAGICYLTMLSDRDINYYLSVKPPVFWRAVIYTSLAGLITLVGLLWIYLRWFLALPILLFEGVGVRKSICQSSARSAGRTWQFALEVLGVAVGSFALMGVSALLLKGIDKFFLGFYGEKIQMVVIGGALILVIHFVLTSVITFIAFSAQCLFISRHYLQTAPAESEPIAGGVVSEDFSFLGLKKSSQILWLGLLAFFSASLLVGWGLLEDANTDRQVAVTAHRGSSVDAPENTLSALRLAIGEGADFAEIDIQINADDELVMIHDSELKRVSGVDLKVADMTREQRLELDVGAWFSAEFKGEPLPTLDEVIDLVRGKMKLNIELKFGPDREGLNRAVADLIKAKKYADECVVTSLDYPGLKDFKLLAPEVATGLIVTSAVGDVTRAETDFLSLNASQVTRSMVAAAEAQGKEVHVWTVNDPIQMQMMIELGVDNILTDTPKVLVDILKQREELTNTELLILQLRSRLAN